jgi:hypothetical protein
MFLCIVICIVWNPISTNAYSVLTHEAIIDAIWEKSFVPLLLVKYPGTTQAQLNQAHAYAYGGAIAPDIGYFPFGSHLFTNLVHYARSGDFVNEMIDDARDVNEYAFALGFLCHYMADKYGHFLGTNRCVPIAYPKMEKKYGMLVTYEEDHLSHSRMEFAFDVLQTANGNYASQAYHSFIGFEVSRSLLERAFPVTYGLDINKVFDDLSLAIESFRFAVMSLFPALTRAAWVIKNTEILKSNPTATSRSFKFKMRRSNYYEEFGKKHLKPGIFATVLSFIIHIIPNVGLARSLNFKAPGPLVEKIFISSFDTVLVNCSGSMALLGSSGINLNNIDFDTGNITAANEYKLADKNYGLMVLKLRKNNYGLVNKELKQNISEFYHVSNAGISFISGSRKWKKLTLALKEIQALSVE